MKPTLSFSCALALIAPIASPTAAAAIMNFFIALSELLREASSGRRARAAEQYREGANAQHRIAERMRRSVIVADRAQDQAGARAIEKAPDADDQRDGEVDEGVLAEDHFADQRNVCDVRDVKMRCAVDLLSHIAGADQPGQPDAENGERQA